MRNHHNAEVRVLIADDESLSCAMIRAAVEQGGFTCVGEACDGYQALEMTETLRPDVVLMDIHMPDMDGLRATQRIQAQCPTPVVILTAHHDAESIKKASEYGVVAYLIKPSNAQDIARTVGIAIARFDDMMALREMNVKLQDEVSERAKIEQQLRQILQERNLLLKEVYHRVKNNFMAVSTLLELQVRQATENTTIEALLESVNRVRSMSLIHERLYQSQTLAEINFRDSAYAIAAELFHTYKPTGGVALDVSNEVVMLSAKQAIPCALLLNELVSNALKYAFPDGRCGIIRIHAHREGDEFLLSVSDDGVGLPDGFDFQHATSLGSQLIVGFVQQMQGSYALTRTDGTTFSARFPVN